MDKAQCLGLDAFGRSDWLSWDGVATKPFLQGDSFSLSASLCPGDSSQAGSGCWTRRVTQLWDAGRPPFFKLTPNLLWNQQDQEYVGQKTMQPTGKLNVDTSQADTYFLINKLVILCLKKNAKSSSLSIRAFGWSRSCFTVYTARILQIKLSTLWWVSRVQF